MPDEKHNYDPLEIPIPSYEEATSSRPTSSAARFGPSEISDDAERQGLLGSSAALHTPQTRGGQHGYQAPSVQSVDSEDSDLDIFEDAGGSEHEEAEGARVMEEMGILDPEYADAGGGGGGSHMRSRLSKRISSLTTTLSALNLPSFRNPFPSVSFDYFTQRLPRIPRISEEFKIKWTIVARLVGLFVIISVVYALLVLEVLPNRGLNPFFPPEQARIVAQSSADENRIRSYLKYITSIDHMAGTSGNAWLASWIENHFRNSGMDDVGVLHYEVYLNYPTAGGRRVAIVEPPELAWEAKLEEENVYENPTPQQQQTMVFHGHSRAGNVTGPLVYANYGSREDFKRLEDMGIDVKGSIVLVRYYGTQGDRALKVKAAELAGAVGCLIYSDPKEDGFLKGDVWPKGRWRPSDGVQRGAVSLMSWVVGDILTPGWASIKGAKRVSKDNNPGLVNIPSLPLAWRDAQRLLQVLKGHGQKGPQEWVGGVPGVEEWWTGDKTSPIVHLKNEQDEVEKSPIQNVLGLFRGVEAQGKKIYVGNHRDSWCFGAADPGSGTAVMLEVVNILTTLRANGWAPLRSIYFASWDAEEYNLIGSTEYVEDHIEDLRKNGVAYLNVDVGVVGDEFRAAASPLFNHALMRVLDRVSDPVRNVTLRQLWDDRKSKLEGLGAGSDYVAFQDLAGTSSIDFGFKGPGFPYHSCYETFEWMEQFGDPGFLYHKTLAQVWALLILELAQEPLLPFDLSAYATAVSGYIEDLEHYAADRSAVNFDIGPLRQAAELFEQNAKAFKDWETFWFSQVRTGFETNAIGIMRGDHNARMSDFETNLLDLPKHGKDDGEQHGVPGREQFKHIVFGPQAWSGYDEAYFPAVRDAIDSGDWGGAQTQLEKAARILSEASERLVR
ncbi:hypothetical protein W97_04520 [Coniosporium apollinis CBS 100218]|uniref:Glutamate carboxypeptidase II n=1 Tax=Coniosporium apollinis (strain CBS 100218) TaxID=1168221 RepID=R7YTM9_CONA1|nr:uncharacterized protein W97_04520 [Coniosporium apollinis CBS 100218]EON65282.1 hypothetical protein W97_04520 [Coniosporium apollinis CBS 100218]